MWPWCPVCYSVIVGPPAVKVDTLTAHLKLLHGLAYDANMKLVQIATDGPQLELRSAQANVSAVLLGGSTTVRLTWLPGAMPSTDYRFVISPAPALVLGKSKYELVTKTKDYIDVKFSTDGLALAASTVMAIAGAIVNPTS